MEKNPNGRYIFQYSPRWKLYPKKTASISVYEKKIMDDINLFYSNYCLSNLDSVINMINPKKTVKQLIHFVKREFREKRPFSVRVLRMKSERILTKGGPLKVLSMSQTSPIHYLVVVKYDHHFRLYYYSKEGVALGAQNLELEENTIQKLHKLTVVEYRYPKQK